MTGVPDTRLFCMKGRDLDALVVVLAGGEGQRLKPLTETRLKPAVPIGGKFRLIDIPLSNAYHSRFRKILILAQGRDRSLHRHIKDTWSADEKSDSFINYLSPQIQGTSYAGDADAVRQAVDDIAYYDPDYVLVVPGDHLLRMQFYDFLKYLTDRKGDVIISVIPQLMEKAGDFGSIQVGENSRILSFREKDKETPWRIEGTETFYASMGIYAFKKEVLFQILKHQGDLFGRHLIPKILEDYKVLAYDYCKHNHIPEIILEEKDGRLHEVKEDSSRDGCYWRDVGTIGEYFRANMDLVSTSPRFNLYNREWPFYSMNMHQGPAKVVNPNGKGQVESAIICEGSFLSDVRGKDLVISPSVYISGSDLDQVICFNRCIIKDCRIRRTIIDKNVNIQGLEIGFNDEADRALGIFIDPASGIRVISKSFHNR